MVGDDLSLPAVFDAILGRSWRDFLAFCEEVLTRKEKAERVQQREIAGATVAGGGGDGGDGGVMRHRRRRCPPGPPQTLRGGP